VNPVDQREKPEDAERFLDELQDLLQRQMVLVRQGHWAAAETLAQEIDVLVIQMTNQAVTETPVFDERRVKVETLYRNLRSALAAARDEAQGQIKLTHKSRKAISAYRRSLMPR
jgi:hypothetical protein